MVKGEDELIFNLNFKYWDRDFQDDARPDGGYFGLQSVVMLKSEQNRPDQARPAGSEKKYLFFCFFFMYYLNVCLPV